MSLHPSLRRGALAATVVALSVAGLGACAAGNDAPTLQVQADTDRAEAGDLKVQNALVISQPDPKAGPAAVTATLFNNGNKDETLESITLKGGSKAELKPAEGQQKIVVPAHGSIVIGGTGAEGKPNAVASVAKVPAGTVLGSILPVTFTFSGTGDVALEPHVVPAQGQFGKWGPKLVPGQPSEPPKPPTEEHGGGHEEGGHEEGGHAEEGKPEEGGHEAGHQGAPSGEEGVAPGEHDPTTGGTENH